jgi:hypothetical protein
MRNSRSNSIVTAALSLATVAAVAQSPTTPPPSQHPILTVAGKGVQIYTCQQSSAGPQWVLQAPEATLIDASGNTVGTHSAGPTWKSTDSSSIKGEVIQKSP